jgi:outer membrane lipoprotein-sorting protein
MRTLILLLIAAFFLPARAQSADTNATVVAWLAAQTNIQTWSADFVQIRTLKALTQPLTANGHVWFAAPGRFRWEINAPTKSIALRQESKLWVIYPTVKRAEIYALDSREAGQWKDMLALLDAGFPRNRAEVDSRFQILSQHATEGVREIALEPKSDAARQMMPQIKLEFDAGSFSLRSTEMVLGDGSTMKNIYSNAVVNPKLEETIFKPPLESDYKISEPMKRK